MQEFIVYVKATNDPYLPEDINNLPIIQIVKAGIEHRSVGIEQISEAILELEPDLDEYSEYIPFKVEIWDRNEPGSPIRERRRRRIRREEGGV